MTQEEYRAAVLEGYWLAQNRPTIYNDNVPGMADGVRAVSRAIEYADRLRTLPVDIIQRATNSQIEISDYA